MLMHEINDDLQCCLCLYNNVSALKSGNILRIVMHVILYIQEFVHIRYLILLYYLTNTHTATMPINFQDTK